MSERCAVVRIKDVQYRVQPDEVVRVPRLDEAVGSSIEFDQVLMISGDEIQVGTPVVEGAKVKAKVVEHGREKKIVVFKMKRRKNYRRTRGHRQQYTDVRITSIDL